MAGSAKTERQHLSADEAELIEKTHFPALAELSDEDLHAVAQRVRDSHAGLRVTAAELRRTKRAKAPPADAEAPQPGAAGSLRRKQILAKALVRVKRELDRREGFARRHRKG